MVGSGMQQARKALRGANRRSCEKQQGRSAFEVGTSGPTSVGSGILRVVSTEGRYLKNPMRGARKLVSCFGEKAVTRAAQSSACFVRGARVFPREAMECCV
jgi:hypothetical protein